MNGKKLSSLALATAAAVMFSTAPVTGAHAEEAKVKCEGVNSCKGKSDCSTATNNCAGKNNCGGHGFKMMTKAECDAAKAKLKK